MMRHYGGKDMEHSAKTTTVHEVSLNERDVEEMVRERLASGPNSPPDDARVEIALLVPSGGDCSGLHCGIDEFPGGLKVKWWTKS